uniref:Zinc finger, CCHC-type n=1 Tax=Tanacetum cinerariifolium TaxID=118510 RepID=A0A6L2MVZ6_TANCI|nr:hypothetical protein [Tanacetum cinerariifolium]
MNPDYTVKPVVRLKIRVVRPDDQWSKEGLRFEPLCGGFPSVAKKGVGFIPYGEVFPTTTFFDYANTLMLTGDNFAEWKENVLLTLGCMDLDLALCLASIQALGVLSLHVMKKLSNMTLDKVKGVREHIMKIRDIASKLSSLKVEISESMLVHFILNSLPSEYTLFKISYNTHKEN